MVLKIDGSYGEGGGQILRTSLAFSCLTGKQVEIANIRKMRTKPGLQPQHLAAVSAAAAITRAFVEGAELSSTALKFSPGPVMAGNYSFDVSATRGSAGSSSLVLQTIILPLCFADRASKITVIGGTHVPWSPSFHYLKHVFLPMLARVNVNTDLEIQKWGWYPVGGGKVVMDIIPQKKIKGMMLTRRGELKRVSGISAVSNLPMDIALRQRNQAVKCFAPHAINPEIEILSPPSPGKGTLLFLLSEFENISAGFASLGALGKRAETVADEACESLLQYLAAPGVLDPYLPDQLISYLALAQGISELTTTRVTRHLLTNIWVIKQFLDIEIRVEGKEGEPGMVSVFPKTDKSKKSNWDAEKSDNCR